METPVAQLTAMLDERFDYPAQWDKTKDARITPLRDDLIGAIRPALLATLGAMVLILLIACANVAALMLGQVEARSVEFAVRSALGASRRRLTQSARRRGAAHRHRGRRARRGARVGRLQRWSRVRCRSARGPRSAAPDWRVFAVGDGHRHRARPLLAIVVPAARALPRRSARRARQSAHRRHRGARRTPRERPGRRRGRARGPGRDGRGAARPQRGQPLRASIPGVRTEGVAVVDVMLGERLPRAAPRADARRADGALERRCPACARSARRRICRCAAAATTCRLVVDGRPDIKGMTSEFRMVTPWLPRDHGLSHFARAGCSATADRQRLGAGRSSSTRPWRGSTSPATDPIGQRDGRRRRNPGGSSAWSRMPSNAA